MRFQSTSIPKFGEERIEQTEQKSNGSTKCNQCIHIAPSQFSLFPSPGKETTSEKDHDRDSKYHLNLIRVWYMHQYHGKHQQRYYQNPSPNHFPRQTSVPLMLLLFPAFLPVGFFHNQVITCRKHSRTDFSGSQLILLIRNGQRIGSKINGSLDNSRHFFHCFFYIISTSCTVHIKYRKCLLYCVTHIIIVYAFPDSLKGVGKEPLFIYRNKLTQVFVQLLLIRLLITFLFFFFKFLCSLFPVFTHYS